MKDALKIIGAVFLASAVLIVICLATGVISLGFDRAAAPYAVETQRRVYQNSVARQQGANNGIGQDCANMEGAAGAEKVAFAHFVLADAAAYSGDRGLSDASQQCVSEAKSALASAQ